MFLRGGFPAGEEDRLAPSHFQPKKLENWEDQILIPSPRVPVPDAIKQEVSQNSSLYGHGDEEFQAPRSAWSQVMTVSSPQSCVTSFSTTNNLFDFPYDKLNIAANQHADHSSEVRETFKKKISLNYYLPCLRLYSIYICPEHNFPHSPFH